jgi:hypothetical protein
MTECEAIVREPESSVGDVLSFTANDVTGTFQVTVEVEPELLARAVTESLAEQMSLPKNVPWALREDSSSAFLLDDQPIGEQIEPGASVTVTPKSHLGARRR